MRKQQSPNIGIHVSIMTNIIIIIIENIIRRTTVVVIKELKTSFN